MTMEPANGELQAARRQKATQELECYYDREYCANAKNRWRPRWTTIRRVHPQQAHGINAAVYAPRSSLSQLASPQSAHAQKIDSIATNIETIVTCGSTALTRSTVHLAVCSSSSELDLVLPSR